jgi:predicted nucleic acid-binding protein
VANNRLGIACVVDTDIIINFLRGYEITRQLLNNWAEEGLLAVSAVTHLEVYYGMKSSEEPATEAFLNGLQSIPVDVYIARQAGQLLSKIRSRGVTVGIADAIIAATTLQLDVPLLTNNIGHYPFAGLKVIQGVLK